MTTELFPGAVHPGPSVAADSSPPEGRWVLHRAGIVNVWQYDRVEFGFARGRLLLRGKNGAGKSKALELLLPFLLDGDTRQLDATGRDRTTVSWLMTEGRAGGNHVGYVWLELRCGLDDGGETFQTLGAGLKASTATRRADSWFFLTPRRVGIDFDLAPGGECLPFERLKEALGDDAVTASGAEHRRRVGRHLFGLFDDARYRNLLHLLHRLRDPNIGNRVEAGELASVLSDALPPVDERVLVEAAGHFDDLDAIREQVDRSTRTAAALDQFLAVYRGYSRTVLRRRAAAVTAAESDRARAARATRQLTRGLAEADERVGQAQQALDAAKRERAAAEDERRQLERSEAYRAHQDLADRQERVAALDTAARASEAAAERAAAAHERARVEVSTAADGVRRSLAAAAEATTAASGLAADAGLDPAFLGPLPTAGADGDVDPAQLQRAEERARAARLLVDGRRRRATDVRKLAQEADRAAATAAAAEERAARSESEVEAERAQVAAARASRRTTERAWADAVTTWMSSSLAATLDIRWEPVTDRLAARPDEPGWVPAVRQAVTDAVAPTLQAARRAAAAATLAVAVAEDALATDSARLAEVEAQTEARPAPARCRGAVRDPAAGAPLYELVDVAPGVDAADAAGLEAALEAAGLLDAWVHADGLVVHPDTLDTLIRADAPPRPPGAASLADALVPAAPDGSPVGPETIAAVLSAIGLGEQPGAPAWIDRSGRFGLGVVRGAWRKARLEFLGAAARRATRERLLAELRQAVAAAQARLAGARAEADAAAGFRDAVEALPVTLPPAQAIDEAARELHTAERALAAARARHDIDRRGAEAARAAANRQAATVADEAQHEGLPTSVGGLDDVLEALAGLRDVLADHRRALHDLGAEAGRLADRRAEESNRRDEASGTAADAAQRRADHDRAAAELARLREALGATVDAVLARHGLLTAHLDELDATLLPEAEQALRAADTARATTDARLGEARASEEAASAVLSAATHSLETAVALPGVLLAAAGPDAPLAATDTGAVLPPDPGGLARAVATLAADGDDVSDGMILSRYDRLSDALAGGYDTAIDEDDGIKVVHVADDTGRQPLAAVAARLAEEAEAARGRLAAREREVLERFLLRELAEEVRAKLLDAHDLVTATNRTLAGVRTSHGKGAHLEWRQRDDTSPAATAVRLLLDDLRDEAADTQLRDALLALIDSERAADPSGGYEQHLRAALDYRAWHGFTVKVTDSTQPGSFRALSNRLGLSQGEQRVLSYLALFAAAAAHFEAIARETPTAPRLLLLDDAFAKVDEPTHAQLLGLLVDLHLDFVLTSERMWGCFPSVPALEIYEAIRDPAHPGVALVHFRWDGHHRHLVGV